MRRHESGSADSSVLSSLLLFSPVLKGHWQCQDLSNVFCLFLTYVELIGDHLRGLTG